MEFDDVGSIFNIGNFFGVMTWSQRQSYFTAALQVIYVGRTTHVITLKTRK